MTNRTLSLQRELLPPGLTLFFGFAAMASNQYHTLLLETAHGFTAAGIGTTVMLGAATQIILPWIILHLGNRWKRTDQILRASYFLMAVFLILLPRVTTQAGALLTYIALVIALNTCAVLQITSIIAATRQRGDSWFLVLRSGGTLGYAATCLLSAHLAKFMDMPQLYTVFAGFAILALISSVIGGDRIPVSPVQLRVREIARQLWQPGTPVLIGAIALANMAVFGALAIIGNFMHHELNATPAQISKAWTIATFSEIPLIWISIWILHRFGLKALLLTGLLTSTVRMALIWAVTDLDIFYATQVFHGLFFGSTLSGVGIHLARRYSTASLHGLQMVSQVIYGGLATSIGGQAAGWIWAYAGLRMVYLAAFACLGIATLWLILAYKAPGAPEKTI